MSYEYKESMKEDLQHLYEIPTGVWKYKEKLEELYEVYAQAAKADEYEAKANAWDKYKAHMESHIAGEINEEELVSDLKSDYFESGQDDDQWYTLYESKA